MSYQASRWWTIHDASLLTRVFLFHVALQNQCKGQRPTVEGSDACVNCVEHPPRKEAALDLLPPFASSPTLEFVYQASSIALLTAITREFSIGLTSAESCSVA